MSYTIIENSVPHVVTTSDIDSDDGLLSLNFENLGYTEITVQVEDPEGFINSDTFRVEYLSSPNKIPESVFGTQEKDILNLEGSHNLVFTGQGNDLVDTSFADGNNRVNGGSGDDIFILGSDSNFISGEGIDRFFAGSGGNNILTDSEGRDQFWIATAKILDLANTITDFELGVNVLEIAGLEISFDDLSLTQDGNNTSISISNEDLLILSGIESSSLGADHDHLVLF